MDARQYDPAIGRWMVHDPIVHHNQSPYSAFNGNPIYWADPSGMAGEHYDWDTGKYVNNKGKEVSFDTALASVTGNGSEKSGGNDSEGNNGGETGGNKGEGGDPPKKDWKYYLKGIKGIFTGGERKDNLQISEFPEAATFFLGGAEVKATNEAIELISLVKTDSKILKLAKETFSGNKTLSKEANALLQQLSNGNMNPGIGTKVISGSILEARSAGGARVYFRKIGEQIEILAYSAKSNQQAVIDRILKIF